MQFHESKRSVWSSFNYCLLTETAIGSTNADDNDSFKEEEQTIQNNDNGLVLLYKYI
jgi:hypothetical protein